MFYVYSFSQENDNIECGFYRNKSVKQRNALFPFNRSKKILLISYLNEEKIEETFFVSKKSVILRDSLTFSDAGYPIFKEFKFQNNDKIIKKVYDATKLVELDENEINEISNLMFNYNYRIIDNSNKLNVRSNIKCYVPRNAIIFLDDKNKVISVLEICFECKQYYLFPSSKNFGKASGFDCDKTLDYFKDIFLRKDFNIEKH